MNFSIFFFIFSIYWLFVIILDRKGILEKYNITAIGPILMIRSKSALSIIEILSKPKKFWRVYGNVGIIAMFLSMVFMFLLVLFSVLSAILSIQEGYVPEAGDLHRINNIFLIPGLNDYIPLWSGAIALFITLIVHEFAHAILCRAQGLEVKSIGVLLAIVPIGGFAEPDAEQLFDKPEKPEYVDYGDDVYNERVYNYLREEKIKKFNEKPKATVLERLRILSAGIMGNFVVALIAMILFFGPILGMIAPVGNLMVNDVSDSFENNINGVNIEKGMIITHINGQKTVLINDAIDEIRKVNPGDYIEITAVKDKKTEKFKVKTSGNSLKQLSGVTVDVVQQNTAAEEFGLKKGMVIYQVNDQRIETINDLSESLKDVKPGEKTEFYVLNEGKEEKLEIIPRERPGEDTKSYFGFQYRQSVISSDVLGFEIIEFNAEGYLEGLKTIPKLITGEGGEGVKEKAQIILAGVMLFMVLPFFGLAGEGFLGFSSELAQFYEPIGFASAFGPLIFMVSNILIWTAWINFYVGLFNCLPAIPLDGGHVFEAATKKILDKAKLFREEKTRALSSATAKYMSFFIFGSFILMFIWPYLGKLIFN